MYVFFCSFVLKTPYHKNQEKATAHCVIYMHNEFNT